MWGQSSLTISGLSPKRDCGTKRVKVRCRKIDYLLVRALSRALLLIMLSYCRQYSFNLLIQAMIGTSGTPGTAVPVLDTPDRSRWYTRKSMGSSTRNNYLYVIWASLRFLWGRHLQTTLSIGYYIGFSVEFTTEPFFLTQFSYTSIKTW